MQIKRVNEDVLKELGKNNIYGTVFMTYPWVDFLKKNQKAEPVVLEISNDEELLGYFVGLIIKKFGIRILGSPFEGWLTPDMGFIRLSDFDINDALMLIKKYALKYLRCMYVRIVDKSISCEILNKKIKYNKKRVLLIDNSHNIDDVLNNFTQNGRRDVRAFSRKGATIRRVAFDRIFADQYYDQLVDVFKKQNLKPNYGIDKLYDMVDAFEKYQEFVLALEAVDENQKCIATILSFGNGNWGYYLGAASYREYQKLLPNEGLFWEFVKYWNEKGVVNLDLVGYRKYKMKYNPTIVEVPEIYFERIWGLTKIKSFLRKIIVFFRKLKGA